jgi:hypothetical protein
MRLLSEPELAGTQTTDSSATQPRSNLLFSSQFMLGRSCPDSLPDWRRHQVAADFHLATHPGLSVTQATHDDRTLTLVGFLLDPADPRAGDHRIVGALVQACSTVQQLIAATLPLGGRWLLIFDCAEGLYLFNDPLGLRQAFYTEATVPGGVWALSQPGLAAEVLGLELDTEASAFADSHQFRSHLEYRWPAASSPVRGLYHLLPNHHLDLRSGKATRYWPDRPLAPLPMEQAMRRVGEILQGLMQAVAARFELALGMTAGLDSRLVLAASRSIKEQVCYVTVRQRHLPDDSQDLVVPARLLRRLGLHHEVIRAHAGASADFSWRFKRSVMLAHDHYGADAEAILAHFGRRKVVVTGSGAEVARCSFRQQLPFSDWRDIHATQLAKLQNMDGHPFALRHFDAWLGGIDNLHGVKLLDLFEWEQGHGNWLAMTQMEFDIAWRDIFTPYNCRELLLTLLAVEERVRRHSRYRLFHELIESLWPEVLTEPVNPHDRRRQWRRLRRKFYSLSRYWS